MDPVCHSLVGLTMGQAGLARRTPLAVPTLVLAANAPDIDVVTMFTTDVWMFYRRGWTHGPIAMVVLPLAVTGAGAGLGSTGPAPPPARGATRRPPARCCGSPCSARCRIRCWTT